MPEYKFFTVTDENTGTTNSRSTRYPSFEAAEIEAMSRVKGGRATSVYILQVIAKVEPKKPEVQTRTIRL